MGGAAHLSCINQSGNKCWILYNEIARFVPRREAHQLNPIAATLELDRVLLGLAPSEEHVGSFERDDAANL